MRVKVGSFLERKEFIRRGRGRRQGSRGWKGLKFIIYVYETSLFVPGETLVSSICYLSAAALHTQSLEIWIHV